MISKAAHVTIERIPVEKLHAGDTDQRFLEKLLIYIDVLTKHPDLDADPLIVTPSPTHKGMYKIINGHHRFCALIMTSRYDCLCIVFRD